MKNQLNIRIVGLSLENAQTLSEVPMINILIQQEPIKIKKMSQNFPEGIFGVKVDLEPGHPIQPCQLKNKSNPFPTFVSQSTHSQHDYLNSSLKSPKYKLTQAKKKLPDAMTNYTDSQSLHRSGFQLQGVRNNKSIENCNPLKANAIKQVQLKKLTKNDNFYCACNQKQEHYGGCIVCRGIGFTDGNNNMARFIQYIMEFKTRNKQVYQNQKTPKISNSICQKNIQQTKSSKNLNQQQNITNLNKLQQQNKKQKKTISLVKKMPTLTKVSQTNQPINQFCAQFIKNQTNNSQQQQKIPQINSNIQQNFTLGNVLNRSINPFQFLNININSNQNENQQRKSIQNNNSNLSNSGYNGSSSRYSIGMQQKNISSIDVGITTMSKSIVDDTFGNKFSQSRKINKQQPQQIPSQYGYNQISKNSTLLKSCITPANRKSITSSSCLNIQQLKQKLSIQNTCHYGFCCDNCDKSPIIGIRYHCCSLMCDNDYDLCLQCFNKIGHKHKMEQIGGNKHTEKLCQKIQKFQQVSNKSIKVSTRLSLGTTSIQTYGKNPSQSFDQSKMIFKSSIH